MSNTNSSDGEATVDEANFLSDEVLPVVVHIPQDPRISLPKPPKLLEVKHSPSSISQIYSPNKVLIAVELAWSIARIIRNLQHLGDYFGYQSETKDVGLETESDEAVAIAIIERQYSALVSMRDELHAVLMEDAVFDELDKANAYPAVLNQKPYISYVHAIYQMTESYEYRFRVTSERKKHDLGYKWRRYIFGLRRSEDAKTFDYYTVYLHLHKERKRLGLPAIVEEYEKSVRKPRDKSVQRVLDMLDEGCAIEAICARTGKRADNVRKIKSRYRSDS